MPVWRKVPAARCSCKRGHTSPDSWSLTIFKEPSKEWARIAPWYVPTVVTRASIRELTTLSLTASKEEWQGPQTGTFPLSHSCLIFTSQASN